MTTSRREKMIAAEIAALKDLQRSKRAEEKERAVR